MQAMTQAYVDEILFISPQLLILITHAKNSFLLERKEESKMLGPHCTENPPTLSSTCGAGNIQEIGGLQTYVTGNQDSKLAILLAADAFGKLRTRLS